MSNASDELKKRRSNKTERPCIEGGLAYHFIKLFNLDESILND